MTDMTPDAPTPDAPRPQTPKLTRRERRRRIILLTLLLLLIALLAYATYYYFQNRRLPSLEVGQVEQILEPPQFLYAITGTGANTLQKPVGVGVAQDGRVYVVNFGKRQVDVFTNAGRYLFSFSKTAADRLRNPVHLWIKGDEVWVTDRRYRTIFVFDLEGKFLREFEPKNEDLNWTPLALAFSPKGELRVTDVAESTKHQVMYFSEDGSRTATFGETVQVARVDEAPGGFYFPNGLAVADNGDVFVSDGDNRRIQVFDSKGEFKQFVDTSGVPRGIAIDEENRLFVVDAVAHTIDVYSLEGERLTQFGSQGFGPGQFNFPNDVAIDSRNGRIFISDRDNNQVQVWGWPVAALPAVALPSSPLGWALCLTPLLLLPLLLLLRKTRIVVTPDFVDALVAAQEIKAVADKRRLRLVAPEVDLALYEGRVEQDVDLAQLIEFEAHSESDARAMQERYELSEHEAILFSMALRLRGLASEDRETRRNAALVDVRVMDLEQFRNEYLRR